MRMAAGDRLPFVTEAEQREARRLGRQAEVWKLTHAIAGRGTAPKKLRCFMFFWRKLNPVRKKGKCVNTTRWSGLGIGGGGSVCSIFLGIVIQTRTF